MKKFTCKLCGRCCRWPGAVKLENREPDEIAAYLGMSVGEFIGDHCELTMDRQHLSLCSKADGSCEYLSEDSKCLIDPVKPRQCRDFPEKWNFPGWENECAGGKDYLKEEL